MSEVSGFTDLTIEELETIILASQQEPPDVHTRSAMKMFQVPEEGVTPYMRGVAKNRNYLRMYSCRPNKET